MSDSDTERSALLTIVVRWSSLASTTLSCHLGHRSPPIPSCYLTPSAQSLRRCWPLWAGHQLAPVDFGSSITSFLLQLSAIRGCREGGAYAIWVRGSGAMSLTEHRASESQARAETLLGTKWKTSGADFCAIQECIAMGNLTTGQCPDLQPAIRYLGHCPHASESNQLGCWELHDRSHATGAILQPKLRCQRSGK